MLNYYQNVQSLENFAIYIQQKLCDSNIIECELRLRHIPTADSLDIDYEDSSRRLVLRIYQSSSRDVRKGWSTDEPALERGRTEIGVLAAQNATEKDHLKLGGYVVVLRDEQKLSIISPNHTLSILIL